MVSFEAPTHEEFGHRLATDYCGTVGYIWTGPNKDWPEDKWLVMNGEGKWLRLFSKDADDIRNYLGLSETWSKPFQELVNASV